MRRSSLAWLMLTLAGVGCAAKRLPAGTAPPEYETHLFAPWPPSSAAVSAEVPPALGSAEPAGSAREGGIVAPEGAAPSLDAGRE